MQLQNNLFRDYRKLALLLQEGATFTAFDTETTGLHCQSCRIIEIGAVKFNANGIIGQFNTLINPQCKIPEECTKINNITDEMVKDIPIINEILPDFLDFIKGTYIVAHNAPFDMRFLNAEIERCNLRPIHNKVIDTLHLSRWAFPELKKFNQPILAEMLGIKVTNAHRACDDAFVCGNLFLNIIKHTAASQKL